MNLVVALIVSFGLILSGFVCGYAIGIKHKYDNSDFDGNFVINTTDPNKDVFRIEMITSFGDMANQTYMVFKVVNEDEN